MEFQTIEECKDHIGKEVHLRGWVHRKRTHKKVAFIDLRDVTGFMQCVTKDKEYIDTIDELFFEASVELRGEVVETDKTDNGLEVKILKLNVINNFAQFPITPNDNEEFLLDNRHLVLRTRRMTNILKARAEFFRLMREYFREKRFYEVTGPMFVSTRGEEGGELFELKYFDRKAYLTQTDQMHLEAAIFALEKVYSIVPSFRAEKSRTRRHLTEYWHCEGEEAWTDLDGTLVTQEELICYVANNLAINAEKELLALGADVEYLKNLKTPFKRVTYNKAVSLLQDKGSEIEWGDDLGTQDLRLLMEDEEAPIFVTHWPREIKAFYMKVDETNPELVKCADLIAPKGYGEIIGGSERETDYNVIVENLERDGDDPERYSWYLDLRKYGSVPHSGFGLGTERVLAWFLNLDHIRDAIPFPRTPSRTSP